MKKNIVLAFLLIGCCFNLQAQVKFTPTPVDKSPMDICYYPAGYPVLKIQNKVTEPLAARLIYSRPQRNGRTIFGDLVAYGQLWRFGANEATEIEFYKNVRMGDAKIKKGRYTLYCIPNADKWTIILNKENDTWGAFKYEQKNDLAWVDAPVQKTNEPIEFLSMSLDTSKDGMNLVVGWENTLVSLPIFF